MKRTLPKQKKLIFGIIAIIGALTLLAFILLGRKNCQFTSVKQVIRGESLEPMVPHGKGVTLLEGYYGCHFIQREDIVEIIVGNERVAKIVKGIPGDTVALVKKESGWNILINNRVVQNSQHLPYLISDQRADLIRLYIKDYSIIPANTYFVLGDQPHGSFDSTRWGLVPIHNVVGKIIYD